LKELRHLFENALFIEAFVADIGIVDQFLIIRNDNEARADHRRHALCDRDVFFVVRGLADGRKG